MYKKMNTGPKFIFRLVRKLVETPICSKLFGKGAKVTLEQDIYKKFGLYVENVDQAFKRLAIFSRKRFNGEVIAITGSNGKTSTKNIIASILDSYEKTHS